MKIGVCGPVERLDLLEKLGYDRIELSIAGISEMNEAELCSLKENFTQRKICITSANGMFPGDLTQLYLDEGLAQARAYLAMVMPKLKYLGITTAVFGSGFYRRMPEDCPKEKSHGLIRKLLVIMEAEARKNGVTVVIEPLNKKETNILLTTAEAMEYIRELELPNLKLLVDLYHFYCEGESLERIREYGPYIKHVHIAEPSRRDFMRSGDEYDYNAFMKALKDVGYNGAVMFEGGQGDVASGLAETYPVLRQLCVG